MAGLAPVNASNTEAQLGSGVSGALRAACGPGFQDEILQALEEKHQGSMPPGEAFVTGAGAHPTAKWVVHAAVMDYRDGFTAASRPDEARVRSCYEATWRQIESIDHPAISVAMPALGAGTGQLGVAIPTRMAAETLKAHLAAVPKSRIARVAFYGYSLPEFAAICRVLREELELPPGTIPSEIEAFLDAGS